MEDNAHQLDPRQETLEAATALMALRRRPLLIIFYRGDASISSTHIRYLTLVLRAGQLSRASPLADIDVLIQTYGGAPSTAYQMAQVIHNYADDVQYLVAEYAYSAGTAMCLSGSHILLAENAALSPIDITLETEEPRDETDTFHDEEPESAIQTVGIDHFIQVAKQARIEIERAFRQLRWRSSETDVESAMMCEMVRILGPLAVAHYYREKMWLMNTLECFLSTCFPMTDDL